ncbi:hypothetical protein GGTG_06667 [Gaeumannomyces tritici R3-111a-1]|uniref:Uncharacterized protein n=1 Tax=Gaeumannomyces tritici (strain R3-111a-1) TaxID=644352 RepID=J3NZG8_GAET3|nr:hypothetical protein GGTG_06667 [Gaeumannomyces tritici R3-111a-1]EJT76751.1 hypothetical protein GGTG_06667 [Gaeumannomyces tritici R3-111a-1]
MRLIDTTTLRLGEDAPEPDGGYAIFSHKWGLEEVTFQDMTQLDQSTLRGKAGYAKVENVCRIAREMGLQRVWIDTCCINKDSSAEVSQCLNAMFRWYKKSTVCIVYLHDFRPGPGLKLGQGLVDSLAECQWFQRAWTLQELIAPEYVRFFDHEWKLFGSKFNDKKRVARGSESLEALLVDLYVITHIPIPVLRDPDTVWSYPVGNRMSWAAHRRALYVEDLAYSLIGIFNVSMPMLYGEGNRAFIRLQEEIIKETNDMTIFAWTAPDSQEKHRGILARSPSEFGCCRFMHYAPSAGMHTYAMTNRGLRIKAVLEKSVGCSGIFHNVAQSRSAEPDYRNKVRLRDDHLLFPMGENDGEFDSMRSEELLHGKCLMHIEHFSKGISHRQASSELCCILLRKTTNGFVRESPHVLVASQTGNYQLEEIHIHKDLLPSAARELQCLYSNAIAIRTNAISPRCPLRRVFPAHLWDPVKHLFLMPQRLTPAFVGIIEVSVDSFNVLLVVVFDPDNVFPIGGGISRLHCGIVRAGDRDWFDREVETWDLMSTQEPIVRLMLGFRGELTLESDCLRSRLTLARETKGTMHTITVSCQRTTK